MKSPWIGKQLRGTSKRFYKKQTVRKTRRMGKKLMDACPKRCVSRG